MYQNTRTILPTGLLSQDRPAVLPSPVSFNLPTGALKPDPQHINAPPQGAAPPSAGLSVICTRCFELGLMTPEIYAADERYGVLLKQRSPAFFAWYRRHAPVIVRAMHGQSRFSHAFIKLVWAFVKPWSIEMAYQSGVLPKGSVFGFLIEKIGFTAFLLTGKRGNHD